jgi:hypothetical protein
MAERRKVKKVETATVEEQILGIEPKVEVKKTVDYENATRFYLVTNLKVENATPSEFDGTKIESFIGGSNAKARKELIDGAKSVITLDGDGNKAFKIEVIG